MKLLILITMLNGLTSHCIAQNEWAWANRSFGDGAFNGGLGDTEGKSICMDSLGNTFVIGTTYSEKITLGSLVISSAGIYEDILLVKYDSMGNVVWAKSFGGNNIDKGSSVTIDNNQNIIITGAIGSERVAFDNIILSNSDVNDVSTTGKFFIAKLDKDGNVLWAKSSKGTKYAEGTSLGIDNEHNIYVAGFSNSGQFNIDNVFLGLDSFQNNFIIKFSSEGDLIWATNCIGATIVTYIEVDPFGNLFIAGSFFSKTITIGNFILYNKSDLEGNYVDIFLAKIDGNGKPIWAFNFGGDSGEVCNDITSDKEGNIYLIGAYLSQSLSFGNFILSNPATPIGITFNSFVVKLDSNGKVLMAISSDGPTNEEAFGISVTPSGRIFITGAVWNTTNRDVLKFGDFQLPITDSDGNNIFVVQFDANGTANWAFRSNSRCDNYGFSLTNFHENVVVTGLVGGYNNGYNPTPIYFDDIEVKTEPNSGMFTAMLKPCRFPPTINFDTLTLCKGTSAVLSSTSNENNKWNTGAITQTIEVSNEDLYTVTIANTSGCINRYESTYVKVLPLPDVKVISQKSFLCPDESILLSTSSSGTYLWNNGEKSQSISINTPGNYSVSVTDSFGCKNTSDQIEIILIPPLPELKLFTNCEKIFANTDFNITWHFNNQIIKDVADNLKEYLPQDSGYYYIEITNSCETKKSNDVYFIPPKMAFVSIPNVITPNNDGYNDTFILLPPLKGSIFTVLNRWGERVFHANTYDNNWSGFDLSSGVYYYIIQNRCFHNDIKGALTIIH